MKKNSNKKREKKIASLPITKLKAKEVMAELMRSDRYCTMDLPTYFDFSDILNFVSNKVGKKSYKECLNPNMMPQTIDNVNLDIIINKDGRYGVRPLTLTNPYLYYFLVREICNDNNWKRIQKCFSLFENEHFEATAIPQVKQDDSPETFKGSTAILNWWHRLEQQSIELSLKYRYMFISDISNCFGQINLDSIDWALSLKSTEYETTKNEDLASSIKQILQAMQHGRNIGIPQGSTLFSFIAEIILGYTDMLFARNIEKAQAKGDLPKDLEYRVLRHVDDYRIFCDDKDALLKMSYLLQEVLEGFNFRMNTSKTRITSDLVIDSIKPDKAFYIFNTPIESKRGIDFDGFQKHLMFIYEFSKRFPNGSQLKNQLSAFSRRIDELLGVKEESKCTDVKLGVSQGKAKLGHLWEEIPVMVAIATQIAAENVSVAHLALKVVSQMLNDMAPEQDKKRIELVNLIYKKLGQLPNSQFIQIWLQHITHITDDWSDKEIYEMPLCKLVAKKPTVLWNNDWLNPEMFKGFPIDSIVIRKKLDELGSHIRIPDNGTYNENSF